jgi:putative glycerol-1-phosphate prenyltransferase
MQKNKNIKKNFARGKQLAVLIDPDKCSKDQLISVVRESVDARVDYFLVGGSLLFESLEDCISLIKAESDIPVIIFPGNALQVSDKADAILFISLISGRNPEYLIGHHVIAAPYLKKSGLEILPTAYILIENGKKTSVEYMSNTNPIPADKPEIVVATAMAGEMLGLGFIYLEAGSGGANHVRQKIVEEVSSNTHSPVIVGGGIKKAEEAATLYNAGAGLIVIGNAVESNYSVIREISSARDF